MLVGYARVSTEEQNLSDSQDVSSQSQGHGGRALLVLFCPLARAVVGAVSDALAPSCRPPRPISPSPLWSRCGGQTPATCAPDGHSSVG
jgi:hypothetical protein